MTLRLRAKIALSWMRTPPGSACSTSIQSTEPEQAAEAIDLASTRQEEVAQTIQSLKTALSQIRTLPGRACSAFIQSTAPIQIRRVPEGACSVSIQSTAPANAIRDSTHRESQEHPAASIDLAGAPQEEVASTIQSLTTALSHIRTVPEGMCSVSIQPSAPQQTAEAIDLAGTRHAEVAQTVQSLEPALTMNGFPRICALTLALLLAGPLFAERYALLIGVGSYSGFPDFNLEGPAQDVPAVRDALIRTWHFEPRLVRTLIDDQATKPEILNALDRLAREAKAGDQIFIYFSGHGTSALDPSNPKLGLPLNTGALVPAGVHKSPANQILNQLIVGATDLRPRLAALDAVASVFIVIDSCYSGAAVKSVADHMFASRDIPLGAMSRSGNFSSEDYDAAYTAIRMPAVDPDAYPYKHVIFLSAAAQSEKAYEAKAEALRSGVFHTVDGKPHGFLTDSLLRAFRGDADENHDGIVTYDELRRYALGRVMNLGQTPQLLPAHNPAQTQQPLFAVASTAFATIMQGAEQAHGVTVALSPGAEALRPRLASPGIEVVQSAAADLAITRHGDRYELYIANGVRIQDYADADVPRLLQRVRREPELRRLRDWTFPHQSFHISLAVEPENVDAYALGESLKFNLTADRASYLLLLNIDVSGEVTIVYKSDVDPVQVVTVPTCLGAPAGAEYMKLFAFAAPPKGWDALQVTAFPTDAQQIIRMLETAPPTSAQTQWLTYSTDRRAPKKLCTP